MSHDVTMARIYFVSVVVATFTVVVLYSALDSAIERSNNNPGLFWMSWPLAVPYEVSRLFVSKQGDKDLFKWGMQATMFELRFMLANVAIYSVLSFGIIYTPLKYLRIIGSTKK